MDWKVMILLSLGGLIAGCGNESRDPTSTSGDQEFLEDTAAAHQDDTTAPSPAAEIVPGQAVFGTELAYGEGASRNLVGYVAMPEDAAEPLPGVILIHEWWGLNDNIRAMAKRIAAEGYIALAVDLYGGQVAEDPGKAQQLMAEIFADSAAIQNNLEQAQLYLSQYALSPRVATLGWCLGGGVSLSAGLWMPEKLSGVVMYYGRLVDDPEQLATLNMPLLGLFGANDRVIKAADVQQFRRALNQLDKDATVRIFAGADHGFANPSGVNYNPTAADEAWSMTLEFLTRTLKETSVEAE
jgi:carboxymethylenebutenolidase